MGWGLYERLRWLCLSLGHGCCLSSVEVVPGYSVCEPKVVVEIWDMMPRV